MKRFAVFLTAASVALAIVVLAPTATAKDTWVSVRSKNFLMVGNVSEKDLKQVGARLEQFREVFGRLFTKSNINSPVPTTVIVFKSESSYRPFKPTANTAGYFQSGPDVNYIALTTEVRGGQDPYHIIFHEYTHLLVKNNVENPPTWFNEGLAEYYSTFSITADQKVELGKPITGHVFLLRANKMMPLRTLFQVDQKSPYYNERDKQSIFYAESWALMHYLILGKNGQRREQMAKFLELIRIKVPMDQAFQQAFQTTFETMERELREYIRQDRYPVVDAHFEKKLQLDNDMMSATVSEAEVQAYLGDLLLHSNRSESEAYLQRALALDPNLAMAHAAMGMLRVREGKTDEAHKSLERAAAANSQNYLIHYYYAYALSREGAVGSELVSTFTPETAAKIREELRKAIELRPDFPESYNLLAFVSLVTGTQLDESIAELKRAQHTSPGRNDFTYMLAQIYLHKEDYKTSRQLLEQLNNANVDEELRQRAQGLLRQVAAIEEQKARIQSVRNSVVTDNPSMVQTPYDPSSELRAVLRKPADGENQLQAMLVRIECDAKGIVFVVDAGGDRLLRLKTDRFEHVSITTYSTDASGELTCGPRKPENAVVVSFIPSSDADTKPIITRPRSANSRLKASDTNARIDGLLRALEFVPKDFKLKADK